METKVVKPEETRIFMEGQEVDREYFHTDKLVFGTSELMPGQTGAVDPGHAISHEVFYVVRGTVLLRCGDRLYELKEGMCTNGFYFYRCGFFYRCFTFEYPLYDVL